jgi:hypothetical protein
MKEPGHRGPRQRSLLLSGVARRTQPRVTIASCTRFGTKRAIGSREAETARKCRQTDPVQLCAQMSQNVRAGNSVSRRIAEVDLEHTVV